MAYKVPIPTGGATDAPRCFVPIADGWTPVFVTLIARGLQDWFWDGTDEEIEAANAEVHKWIMAIQECAMYTDRALLAVAAAQGTDGGQATAGTWNARALTTVLDGQDWVSLDSGNFVLAAGVYEVNARMLAYRTGYARLRIYKVVPGGDVVYGLCQASGNISNSTTEVVELKTTLVVAADDTAYQIQQYASAGGLSTNFGAAINQSANEFFGYVELRKVP